MDENNPILCFEHCEAGVKIYCLTLPILCPHCTLPLARGPFVIPLYRSPGPFDDSTNFPFSVVLKPTVGNFLDDYSNRSNLHIGVTDSNGLVYDFDGGGVSRSKGGWTQSLVVYTLAAGDRRCREAWSQRLQEYVHSDSWTPDKYDKESRNCYDFVLGFLRLLALGADEPAVASKAAFCRAFVIGRTTRAAKYISLYRRVARAGTVVQYTTGL